MHLNQTIVSIQVTEKATVWYDNQVVGQGPINTFMRDLCHTIGIDPPYTNHCIRATTITILDEDGFEARHITAISGN